MSCLIQGNEWDYVILSTVRSVPKWKIEEMPPPKWRSEHIGSVGDPHQTNVALTRAKHGLVIIGEIKTRSCNYLSEYTCISS